jgi:hypothetical protein
MEMDTTSPESHDRLRQTLIDEINSLESSARALKSRHNQLVPISRLPCEVLSAIFSLLSVFAWNDGSGLSAWIYVAHVCRRWRETALNYPRFWSHINLTKLTPVGMAEILSRTKMAPLHLKADYTKRDWAHFKVLKRQIGAHASHTRHLNFSGYYLSNVVEQLVPLAPTLESLSLSYNPRQNRSSYTIIPDNFSNCTSLTSLDLESCDIGWKSPFLKGLRILEISNISEEATPNLDDWLDALNELPQLEELSLRYATPFARFAKLVVSRTVTLPSVTYFHINSPAKDCALALAHLLLPALTCLHVDVDSDDEDGEDVRQVIPYVARNVYVLQDIKPIRSVLLAGERMHIEILTSTTPGADVKVCGPGCLSSRSPSVCLMFTADAHEWDDGVDITIFDALLTLLPMNSVSTLTAHNRTRLNKEFWLKHSSRMPLLEQARLVPAAVRAFLEMLAEDTSLDSDGPRLPMLTKLILLHVTLSAMRMDHLRNVLMERVEQGVPLDCLDLRMCIVANCAIQLLAEIVVDVQEPPLKAQPQAPPMPTMEVLGGYHGHYNEVEFDDRQGFSSWYGDTDISGVVEGEDDSEGEDDEDDSESEEDEDDSEDDEDEDMDIEW